MGCGLYSRRTSTQAPVPGLLNKQAPDPGPGSCPPECPQARSCPACKPSDSVAHWGHQGLPVFPFPATCIICLCTPLVSAAGRAGGRPGPGTGSGRDRLLRPCEVQGRRSQHFRLSTVSFTILSRSNGWRVDLVTPACRVTVGGGPGGYTRLAVDLAVLSGQPPW